MSDNNAVIEFDVKLPKLSKNEKETLRLLVEAGRLVGPLYLEQEKDAKNRLSNKDLEKAGKKDPEVLSPYTVVEKINGKIVVTPYHVKYAKLLKPIAEKLNEAARLTENKEFGNYLFTKAKTLTEGMYEELLKVCSDLKPYILNVWIKPVENLDDQIFNKKAVYLGWVGTLDKEGTERFHNYKSIVHGVERKALVPNERMESNKVKGKVLDVLIFSGLMARTRFVGVNLPINIKLVEKFGSEITLFNQPNDLRVKEQILPIFNEIFPKAFKDEYSLEDIRRGYLRTIAMHELAHSFLYYKNAEKNLQDLFLLVDELAATVLGFRMAGSLLLKDRINNKQIESMIVAFLCRSYYSLKNNEGSRSHFSYTTGNSVFINYLFNNGSLRKSGNVIVPNFMKIFLSLPDLSANLEQLLASGSYKDAKKFIQRFK